MEYILIKLLIAIFATYRLAQLISLDNGPFWIFKRLRDWIANKALVDSSTKNEKENRYSTWKSFAHGITCPFCVGVWGSALMVFLLFPELSLAEWFVTTLGVAGVQSIVERYTV